MEQKKRLEQSLQIKSESIVHISLQTHLLKDFQIISAI